MENITDIANPCLEYTIFFTRGVNIISLGVNKWYIQRERVWNICLIPYHADFKMDGRVTFRKIRKITKGAERLYGRREIRAGRAYEGRARRGFGGLGQSPEIF